MYLGWMVSIAPVVAVFNVVIVVVVALAVQVVVPPWCACTRAHAIQENAYWKPRNYIVIGFTEMLK